MGENLRPILNETPISHESREDRDLWKPHLNRPIGNKTHTSTLLFNFGNFLNGFLPESLLNERTPTPSQLLCSQPKSTSTDRTVLADAYVGGLVDRASEECPSSFEGEHPRCSMRMRTS